MISANYCTISIMLLFMYTSLSRYSSTLGGYTAVIFARKHGVQNMMDSLSDG